LRRRGAAREKRSARESPAPRQRAAMSTLRVLIVGGYGTFGERLVQLIEEEPRLTLLVAGRSLERARACCARHAQAAATLVPTAFDRVHPDPQPLAALRAHLVVDASGPFQAYGAEGYRLIEHCLALRVPYLDLADGSEFVAGVERFDAAAREAGVFILSGVSSFPVLTAAVARRLGADFARVRSIRGGIAPSPYARVGDNVIRALASYAGQKLTLRRDGREVSARALLDSHYRVVAVPGQIPLARRRFSLVDVPDLTVLPRAWPQADVWMGAAPVPPLLHALLSACAALVRLGILRSLSFLAGPMRFASSHLRWGEHRGGMFVTLTGEAPGGRPLRREWHLLAEGDDGPLIPSMAVAALVRKCLDGQPPAAGARAALSDVSLEDYEALFARRRIVSGTRSRVGERRLPLYQRLLGPAWDALAPQIGALHTVTSAATFRGRCSVVRGRGPLAWLAATAMGFPHAGADQAITVWLSREGDGERWVRTSGRHSFASRQYPGRRRSRWLVRERFGAVSVDMALLVEGGNLRYVLRRWALFGVPLPLAFGPRTRAFETVEDGQFCFDVEIRLPLAGLVVHYRGHLAPAT
jgi:hypothetical protein